MNVNIQSPCVSTQQCIVCMSWFIYYVCRCNNSFTMYVYAMKHCLHVIMLHLPVCLRNDSFAICAHVTMHCHLPNEWKSWMKKLNECLRNNALSFAKWIHLPNERLRNNALLRRRAYVTMHRLYAVIRLLCLSIQWLICLYDDPFGMHVHITMHSVYAIIHFSCVSI